MIGAPRQRISRIENCHIRPNEQEMSRILDAFAVTAAQPRCRSWPTARPVDLSRHFRAQPSSGGTRHERAHRTHGRRRHHRRRRPRADGSPP
ncbi:hypothetical protein [Dactylosporangium sp. CA-233914]|uniref:hypothetical protein n=1 Tax=Dactylosporangium sp. CA-233914 TaxID=3239934 RepID=UPI003D8E8BBB